MRLHKKCIGIDLRVRLCMTWVKQGDSPESGILTVGQLGGGTIPTKPLRVITWRRGVDGRISVSSLSSLFQETL